MTEENYLALFKWLRNVTEISELTAEVDAYGRVRIIIEGFTKDPSFFFVSSKGDKKP
jgi:hypothetical protein